MPYTPVAYDQVADDSQKEVFKRADMFLRDVYGMFTLPPKPLPDAGGGNWSIALVLLCVVDGISRHVYPTATAVPRPEELMVAIEGFELLHAAVELMLPVVPSL